MTKNEIKIEPNCEDELNTGLLTVDQACARIADDVIPITKTQRVSLKESLGRVLANDLVSPINVPGHTNSAMDGFAVRFDDLPADDAVVTLTIVGTAYAGHPCDTKVETGEAMRITTGAVVPAGTDCVVMQEFVERDGDNLRVGGGHKAGQNVRAAGEDLAIDQLVFKAGRIINAADIGLIGSLGLAEVSVICRPVVAFFSTGDELQSIGEPLAKGKIYDSNRYTLFGMLSRLGVDIVDMGVVRDTREATEKAFLDAADCADLIVTTGGVSVGDADFVTETLEKVGKTNFWKLAMKPGRPLAFGRVGDALFFGLPGNPVSVMVSFVIFVRPAILKLAGVVGAEEPLTLQVPCTTVLKKRPGRTECQRGVLERDENGALTVSSVGSQGSGILRSMSDANCFIILELEKTKVGSGDLVTVVPFTDLI